MKRLLFHLFAGFSLLLCLAFTALWIRSYHLRDKVIPFQGDLDCYLIGTIEGNLVLQKSYYAGSPYTDPAPGAWIWDYDSTPASVPLPSPSISPTYAVLDHGEFAGFVARRSSEMQRGTSPGLRSQMFRHYTSTLFIPFWFPLLVTLILPVISLIGWITRARYRAPGQCHRCGYDLRATPDQCPECGTKAPPRPTGSESPRKSRPVLTACLALLAVASIALAVFYPEGGLSWFITPPADSASSQSTRPPPTPGLVKAAAPAAHTLLPAAAPSHLQRTVVQKWPRHEREAFKNSIGMWLTYIPAGTFMMGSPPDEPDRENDETRHKVTLTKPYLMGIAPVTQRQWKTVVGGGLRKNESANIAMVGISWEQAVDFCDRLSKFEHRRYRLPTEAEWEYACRARTTTAFFTGASAETLGMKGSLYVGTKLPNAWNLFDMECNVLQWCSDWYDEYPKGDATDPQGPNFSLTHVYRSGSWSSAPNHFRSASRGRAMPSAEYDDLGFRVVLDADETAPNATTTR